MTKEEKLLKVKALMLDGMNRSDACKKLGISRSSFFKSLTDIQKREIDEIYFTSSGRSNSTNSRVSIR